MNTHQTEETYEDSSLICTTVSRPLSLPSDGLRNVMKERVINNLNEYVCESVVELIHGRRISAIVALAGVKSSYASSKTLGIDLGSVNEEFVSKLTTSNLPKLLRLDAKLIGTLLHTFGFRIDFDPVNKWKRKRRRRYGKTDCIHWQMMKSASGVCGGAFCIDAVRDCAYVELRCAVSQPRRDAIREVPELCRIVTVLEQLTVDLMDLQD